MKSRILRVVVTLLVALVGALSVGVLGSPTVAATPFGNALRLTGPADWAGAPDSNSLDLGAAGTSLTMEALVHVPDETSEANQVVFYKGSAYALTINFNTSTPDVVLFDFWTSPISSQTFSIPHAITSGWHHVAASLDNHASGADGFAIFLDGVRIAYNDTAVGVSGFNASANALSVGANSGAVSWDGWIDEARLSDVVRYANDTYAVPSAPFSSDGSTRALWHFDEAVGSAVFADSSANGNTLTGHEGAQTDVPPGAAPVLAFSTASPSAGEGAGSALVTVTRSGGTDSEVAVHYATSDGSATAGSDYTATSGDLTFAAGDTSESFSVPISQDAAVEGDETVVLTLSAPTGGAVLGSPTSATLTILDDDGASAPVLSFTSSNYEVTEGSGSQVVTVQRSGDLTKAVGVSYATSDATATAPADYTATSGVLSFGAGAAYASFPVTIVNDAIDEGTTEWLDLTLSAPTGGAVLGTPSLSRITIQDDEAPPVMSFGSATYSIAEGATSVGITVSRTGDSAGAVTVGYATSNGSAAAGSDYEATSGEIVFMPDEPATQSFQVPILDDTLVEGNETVLLSLTSVAGGTLGEPDTATLTIQDDDAVALLRLSAATYTVGEDQGPVSLTVQRTGVTGTAVSVSYATTDGSAVAGTDYTANSGTLSFSAGETSKTVNVLITDDAQLEGDEMFHVTLSNPQGSASLVDPSSATVTVTDNETPTKLAFSSATYSLTESAGTANVSVQRTGASASEVTVHYYAGGGTATPGADYQSVSGVLVFPPGATARNIGIPVLPDSLVEPSETVEISLSEPTGGATIGTPATAVLTIHDDDSVAGATVSFAFSSRTVTEDAGSVALALSRTGNVSVPSSVGLAVVSGAAGATDYSLPPGPFSFAPGVTTMNVPLLVKDDATREVSESLVISLVSPGAATFIGWPSSATVTIAASDQRPDLWISRSSAAAYTGDDVYDATGTRQKVVTPVRRGRSRTFYVRVYNDGNVANTFRVTGSAAVKGSRVRYLSGAKDVTRAMRSPAGWTVVLPPRAYRLVKVRIVVLESAAVGSVKPAKVRAAWTGDGTRVDVVKAVARVAR